MRLNITLANTAVGLLLLVCCALPAAASDYTLSVFGNANEDETINMQDVTYTELIILEYRDETELSDAKYDDKINMQDVTQIELIILGKEKELTLIDSADRVVTVNKPIERIITPYSGNIETLRSLKATDIIVGIGSVSEPVFLDEFSDVPVIGSMWDPDVEAILNLDPDTVILHSRSTGTWGVALESAQDVLETAGVTVLRFNTNQADIYLKEVEKLGYILGRREEAYELISFYNGIYDQIDETVAEISEDDRPTVYFESSSPYSLSGAYAYIEETGGTNVFTEMDASIDAEAVVSRNPDIILKGCWGSRGASGSTLLGGYGLDVDDTAALKEVRDEIMSRPELENVEAVTNGQVYVMTSRVLCFMPGSGCRHFLQRAYQAKWFHPELFEDLDPQAIHQEYLTEFQGLDIDLNEKGVFVYPSPDES
ncbi:MAG: ABC transporter substrate-binding protein [Candidatus Methanogasteraceae archaeon]